MKILLPLLLTLALAACGGSEPAASGTKAGKPGHVFIIVLENKSYADTFGAGADSAAPYLASELPKLGALLTQYHGTGHVSLDNYISMVGGQSPNTATATDCLAYLDWVGTTTPDANGQVTGFGCVYPPAIKTIANQLQDKGLSWKGYMQDMGFDLARDGSATCSHPKLNSQDGTQSATASDQYATRHNPFMYFHSIIDDQANCDAHVVELAALKSDLQKEATTPNYVFITPNLCADGHDSGCANGDPGGLVGIDDFLKEWVPRIMASPAYQKDGLILVTFDEANLGANAEDAAACCNEPRGPNSVLPGLFGPGGGRIGAVLISPFIKPGTVSEVPYNHYSMLKSIEDLFGLPYLGHAGQAGLVPFGTDVYSNLPGA